MSEQEVQDSQKTVVAFIAGLLVGGLLVWIFAGDGKSHDDKHDHDHDDDHRDEVTEVADDIEITLDEVTPDSDTEEPAPELVTGDGAADVSNQAAGLTVNLGGATYPTDEGWIGVRTYTDGQMTNILGVVRYSKTAGLVPEAIPLQTPTIPGRTYAVVFFEENGDGGFNPRSDMQIETVPSTFEAI